MYFDFLTLLGFVTLPLLALKLLNKNDPLRTYTSFVFMLIILVALILSMKLEFNFGNISNLNSTEILLSEQINKNIYIDSYERLEATEKQEIKKNVLSIVLEDKNSGLYINLQNKIKKIKNKKIVTKVDIKNVEDDIFKIYLNENENYNVLGKVKSEELNEKINKKVNQYLLDLNNRLLLFIIINFNIFYVLIFTLNIINNISYIDKIKKIMSSKNNTYYDNPHITFNSLFIFLSFLTLQIIGFLTDTIWINYYKFFIEFNNIENAHFSIYEILCYSFTDENLKLILFLLGSFIALKLSFKKEDFEKIFMGYSVHLVRFKYENQYYWILSEDGNEYKCVNKYGEINYIGKKETKEISKNVDLGIFKLKGAKNPLIYIKNFEFQSKNFIDFVNKNSNKFISFREEKSFVFINGNGFNKNLNYKQELNKLMDEFKKQNELNKN